MKLFSLLLLGLVLTGTTFAQKATGVRNVDVRNYDYAIEGETVRLKDGVQADACSKKDPDGAPIGDVWSSVSDKPEFGDLDGDGAEEAIITLVANVCGGNMITNEALIVLTSKNGRISQLPNFEYFDEGCEAGKPDCNFARSPGVGARYDAKTKMLVIETSFATDNDAICCPSLFRETWYKWSGSGFVEARKGQIKKREE